MIDPAFQIARLQQAVDLLGGTRNTSRALNISERHLRRLLTGNSPLHTGILADTARVLLEHADACRALERQLSPAFAANLIPDQQGRPKPRGTWSDRSADPSGPSPSSQTPTGGDTPGGGMEPAGRTLVRPAPSAAGRRDNP